MTELEYQKWKRNGNFSLSHARILQVSNDIAEGITENFTKKEAAEVATYHAMEAMNLVDEIAHLRTMGALAIGQKMIEQVEQEKRAQAITLDSIQKISSPKKPRKTQKKKGDVRGRN